MKKYFFMAVTAIAALSSCSNDNEFEPSQIGKQALVFTATMEGSEGTRATYNSDKKCASWEEGDQISINGKTYNAQSAGLTTTFKAATEGQEAEGSTYNAYFACTYDGATATLPAEISETWANGKFNMPMYANSETTSLKFYNLCGVLKITVNSDQLTSVKCITVSSTNCATSGAFTVSDKAAVLTDASNTANTVTVTYTEAVTTDATGKVFYVAVPAQTYQDLTIVVSDGTDCKDMVTKSGRDIVVERNKIYPITFEDNTPYSGFGIAVIDGVEVDVPWVQLWKGGPKFAEYNVFVSSDPEIGNTMTFTDATKAGADYVWGANWCTPSQDQMDELLKAATTSGSEKVKCEYTQENSVWGFKFTGLTDGYTSNSVFFPAMGGDRDFGGARYWQATATDGSKGLYMDLMYDKNHGWDSKWKSFFTKAYVRPVLKN